MQVILTHEQADFDAVASLLGAHLLYETAVTVLPRKMNRNVRAFLTLYGTDLPFSELRDLKSDKVEKLYLVDTQSMVSVKGFSKETQVHIIDHHPIREDLPVNWLITVSGTGANTTVFVETLRERDIPVSNLQATLLLLGIYEDTGSLTYSRTTSRDLRAASFLLEMGADLAVASNFLNHPLSNDQQSLYDLLRKNCEVLDVHGHTIVIAQGDAANMDEELSTVAHKLRDLLDPDALFVLVKIRGGVQLIARSTNDNIDVAAVAAVFGGGGHDRAAAGLIKDRSIEDIYLQLVEFLQIHIKPAVTVASIMSPSPHVLAPETKVDVAAMQMQRYGYEGFPVIKDGKLVGLLTRRAVDRAMTHKLELAVGSLMEAGSHTITPDDSIDALQRLMTDTGWGQVPVVDAHGGNIIGIVTRTDLLKNFLSRSKIPSRRNIAERLEWILPSARLALLKTVAHLAKEHQAALYIVGGFVRDLLLERPSIDFDLVVEGDAIALARSLVQKFGGRLTSHSRFGTAKWHIKDIKQQLIIDLIAEVETKSGDLSPEQLPAYLDLVTARTEFYTHPTALPTVEKGSIKLDLHRRDFTINTLALRLDGRHYGELYDSWGGLSDLRSGVVRVLHSLSFVDDPTRILRAVRFEQRFAFRIEERTLELLKEARPLLSRVSGDRVRHEINSIIQEKQITWMFERLEGLGLLKAIHPALYCDDWLLRKINQLISTDPDTAWRFQGSDRQSLRLDLVYAIWLLQLPLEQARRAIKRLRLASNQAKVIMEARQLWEQKDELVNASSSQVVDLLEDLQEASIYTVYLALDAPEVQTGVYAYISKLRDLHPTVDGETLKKMGIPPGPHYRNILKRLRDAWLDGEVDDPIQELELLKSLIQSIEPTSR